MGEKHMDKAILGAIVGGLIGVCGTLIGTVVVFRLQRLNERRKLTEEFEYIKNKALYWAIVNTLYSQLLPIKEFFLRHPQFLECEENREFFEKWLLNHRVDEEACGVGLWNGDSGQRMREDLSRTRV